MTDNKTDYKEALALYPGETGLAQVVEDANSGNLAAKKYLKAKIQSAKASKGPGSTRRGDCQAERQAGVF